MLQFPRQELYLNMPEGVGGGLQLGERSRGPPRAKSLWGAKPADGKRFSEFEIPLEGGSPLKYNMNLQLFFLNMH